MHAGPSGGPSRLASVPGERIGVLGRLTCFLLAGNAVVSLLLILAVHRQFTLIGQLGTDPSSVSRQTAVDVDDTAVRWSHISSGLFALTALVFLVWLFRADRSGWRHNPAVMRHRSGWAIGGWFVPFLNLVRPYQVMTDVDNASTLPSDGAFYAREPRVRIRVWWGLFLLGGAVWRVADAGNPNTLPALRRQATLEMVGESTYLLAAIAAIVVVAAVTGANERRRADLVRARSASVASGNPVPPRH